MREYKLTIGDRKYCVEIKETSLHSIRAVVNGKEKVVHIDEIKNIREKIHIPHHDSPVEQNNTITKVPTPPVGASSIGSPIPGQIKSVVVKVGDTITAGQKLASIEAMKMENDIKAAHAGKIKLVLISVNDLVDQDQTLFELE